MKKCTWRRLLRVLTAVALFCMLFTLTAAAASAKTVTLPKNENGTYVYNSPGDSYETVYHKIKVPTSGALLVSAAEDIGYGGSTARIWLCNSKKKSLERTSYGSSVNAATFVNTDGKSGGVYYGLKKGTYYIKTKGLTDYMLVATFAKASNTGGYSKSRATTLRKNAKRYGVMPAGEKYTATDWYKFKVTSQRVLKMDIAFLGNGQVQFYLYGPSYKKGTKITSMTNEQEGSFRSVRTRYGVSSPLKIAKGTYYIKVVRTNSSSYRKTSGVYGLRWTLL